MQCTAIRDACLTLHAPQPQCSSDCKRGDRPFRIDVSSGARPGAGALLVATTLASLVAAGWLAVRARAGRPVRAGGIVALFAAIYLGLGAVAAIGAGSLGPAFATHAIPALLAAGCARGFWSPRSAEAAAERG